MAFKDVNGTTKFAKVTDIKVGESITGYTLNVVESSKIQGALNLVLRINGEDISYSVAGNIKYMLKDNKIQMGVNTRITRLADTIVKGKKATKFSVEQDPDDRLEGVVQQAVPAAQTNTSNISEKLKSLRGN